MFEVATSYGSTIWIFENGPKLSMIKRQPTMNNIMYVIYFMSAGMVKTIKLDGQLQLNGIPLSVL